MNPLALADYLRPALKSALRAGFVLLAERLAALGASRLKKRLERADKKRERRKPKRKRPVKRKR